jgi:hypothetical protein
MTSLDLYTQNIPLTQKEKKDLLIFLFVCTDIKNNLWDIFFKDMDIAIGSMTWALVGC